MFRYMLTQDVEWEELDAKATAFALKNIVPINNLYKAAVKAEMKLWDLDSLKLTDPDVYKEIWDYISKQLNAYLDSGDITYAYDLAKQVTNPDINGDKAKLWEGNFERSNISSNTKVLDKFNELLKSKDPN